MSLCLWFLRDFLISKACLNSLIAVYMELGERRGGKKNREREKGESVQQWQWSQSDTVTDSGEKRGRLQSFKGLRK